MSIGLSQYARRFLVGGERARQEHTVPVLVWESAGSAEPGDPEDQVLFGTRGGAPQLRPRAGDPLIFELKKSGNKANAFALGITVGRTETNDISVSDESVSRFHAWFQQDARTGEWRLVDAESTNGTWMGPLRLAPNRAETVPAGAQLRFGNVEMTFLPPAEFLAWLDKVTGGP